ncbi:MAG: NERD domain-containing protein [Cyanobacteria bacterium J06621_8]
MKFTPAIPYSNNRAENEIWRCLKIALEHEPGKAYLGYQPRHENGSLKKESDVLLMHDKWGLCVIEVKGCYLDQIVGIDGDEWQMVQSWYAPTMQPLKQAKSAMFAILKEIKDYGKKELRHSNLDLTSTHLLALPFIGETEWAERFGSLPALRGAILLKEDLAPERIKHRLSDCIHDQRKSGKHLPSQAVKEQLWEFCRRENVRVNVAKASREQDSIATLMREIQYKSVVLDKLQEKIANEIPPGPQRLRGLAGTGKTLLLAQRAAKMHYEHPDWDIFFTFYTKSLYQQIIELIDFAYRQWLEESQREPKSPNWHKLKVFHAWGGQDAGQGFYYNLAQSCRIKPAKYRDFESACNNLEAQAINIPQLYDAVIIDEGQDLPPAFYRLAYSALKEPKRLYWAYDEAQGVESLIIPKPETIFGRNHKTGQLVVDLKGNYSKEDGGASKSHIMSKCYRTPSLLLMSAHAVNMGLFRQQGVLQGVTTKKDWKNLGYEVTSGDFSQNSVKEGKLVTIARSVDHACHEFDRQDFQLQQIANPILKLKTFDSDRAEQEWIAAEVVKDINLRGLAPEDLLITGVYGRGDFYFLKEIKQLLINKGINAHHVTPYGEQGFRKPGHVTLAHIYYAKGNESWKVYGTRFDYADRSCRAGRTLIHKRNEAFTVISRSKAWCVVTGKESSVFEELRTCQQQFPQFSFRAFNSSSLQRITDDDGELANEETRASPRLKILQVVTKKKQLISKVINPGKNNVKSKDKSKVIIKNNKPVVSHG